MHFVAKILEIILRKTRSESVKYEYSKSTRIGYFWNGPRTIENSWKLPKNSSLRLYVREARRGSFSLLLSLSTQHSSNNTFWNASSFGIYQSSSQLHRSTWRRKDSSGRTPTVALPISASGAPLVQVLVPPQWLKFVWHIAIQQPQQFTETSPSSRENSTQHSFSTHPTDVRRVFSCL